MSRDTDELKEVLEFWFEELSEVDWYAGGEELDTRIRERFSELHGRVAAGEYWKHRTMPENYLAEVIVLDQFSRQIFRNDAKAFAFDGIALTLAQQAIVESLDADMSSEQKQFLYMPFMHSESRAIHVEAVKLFESLGNEEVLKYEQIHKDIIDRFGRYPHRNEQLGRESTTEETEYLATTIEDFF